MERSVQRRYTAFSLYRRFALCSATPFYFGIMKEFGHAWNALRPFIDLCIAFAGNGVSAWK